MTPNLLEALTVRDFRNHHKRHSYHTFVCHHVSADAFRGGRGIRNEKSDRQILAEVIVSFFP